MEDVYVLSAVRTPIGKYGGGLASVPPCDLAALVVREAVGRSGADPADVGHAVFGNVIHTEVRDMYLARVAALNGGLPTGTPALTLNRLCGSGLQAIVSAAQAIMLGDCRGRGGGRRRVDEPGPVLAARHALGPADERRRRDRPHDRRAHRPVRRLPHGRDGRERRRRLHVSRADQDALAVQSHRRAAAAATAGYFAEQIVPVEVRGRKSTTPSRPTSTSGPASARTTWPGCGRRSRARARSPRATRRASTTPPRPWCSARGRSSAAAA